MWPFKKKPKPTAIPEETTGQIEFEEYLGLGKLSDVSSQTNGSAVGKYVDAAGEPIYKITVAPDRVTIEEFFHGEQVRFTTDANLQEGFLKHIALGGIGKNTRIVAHRNELERKYNATVHLGGLEPLDVVAFYPAGLLFTVRLPIVEQNTEAIAAYWEAIEADTTDVPIPEAKQRVGTILTLRNGEVHAEPIRILEVEVALYDLEPMIEEMNRRGLIASPTQHRLEALDDAFVGKGGFLVSKSQDDGVLTIFARVMAKDEPALRAHFRKLAAATYGDLAN